MSSLICRRVLSAILLLGIALLGGCNEDLPGTGPTESANSSTALEKGGPPSTPPADPSIAYSGNSAIAVMNADGTNLTNLSVSGSHITWSPDGRKIAFNYNPSGGPAGIYIADISVVNGVPKSSNLRFLTAGMRAEWSPLGSEIAYMDSRETQVLVISPNGGTPTALYTVLYDTSLIRDPTWRSDGSQIAFVEGIFHGNDPVPYYLRVLDRASGVVSTALSAGTDYLFNPEWARTSDRLAYNRYVPFSGGIGKVYTVDIASGTQTLVANGDYPSWSPDDTKLVYRDGGDVKTITLATGAVQLLKRNGGSYLAWRR